MSVNICMVTFETRTLTQRHVTLFVLIMRSLPIALYFLGLNFIIIIFNYSYASQQVCCGHYSTHSLIGHLSVDCQGLEVFLRGNVDLSFCGTYDTRGWTNRVIISPVSLAYFLSYFRQVSTETLLIA